MNNINQTIYQILQDISSKDLAFLDEIYEDSDFIIDKLIMPKFKHLENGDNPIKTKYLDYYLQYFQTADDNPRQPFEFTLVFENDLGTPVCYAFCEVYIDYENQELELTSWRIICANAFAKMKNDYIKAMNTNDALVANLILLEQFSNSPTTHGKI